MTNNTESIEWKYANKTLNDWLAESKFEIEQSERAILEHQNRIKGIVQLIAAYCSAISQIRTLLE